jgi:hypothetical protein
MKMLSNVKLPAYGYLISLLLSSMTTACYNEPHFSHAPPIEFKGFSKYALEGGTGVGQQKRDSLIVTIGFKNGDGNLGDQLPLTSQDLDRYKQTGGWGNYKIRAFRLENNQYKEQDTGENTFLLFPQLSREGKTGAIEGSLDFRQIYT